MAWIQDEISNMAYILAQYGQTIDCLAPFPPAHRPAFWPRPWAALDIGKSKKLIINPHILYHSIEFSHVNWIC
jgi:hypothetical protein